jgi:hypothetical protein
VIAIEGELTCPLVGSITRKIMVKVVYVPSIKYAETDAPSPSWVTAPVLVFTAVHTMSVIRLVSQPPVTVPVNRIN